MKRRQLLGYAGAGAGAILATGWLNQAQAQTSGVTIKSLGHTAFLFTGGGRRILSNPFRQIGCTAGFPSPAVAADIVMISSLLFDEGYLNDLPGEPRILTDPGVYEFENLQVQGILTPHDREGGRRFGTNTVWKWTQGGVTIVHMGGAAAPLGVEEQILLGRPDIMLVPVGNGPKAYNPAEAVQAVQVLKPKIVIPTHYLTTAADEGCELNPVDDFLALMQGTPVTRATSGALTVRPNDLPSQGMRIQVYQYPTA
ncbi:MBL fold metallo-hydrolase [Nodosilinea sp. LEGE 07088]|uniref:MBL fold metallo-hydrolase n=1 Tax=Nodosilinea sp. LEGE 07088 TaxID=2777968 RepID=UPI00188211ED|nr:MBL fold metallo-hydrolase [Nodosilinea sp. LEGE 07088]MBE9137048.1 MBL fold metallo-hydrolase [Nodosilinea sp. LEGE 07088]